MNRKEFLKLSSTGTLGLMFSTPLIGRAFTGNELQDGSSFDVLIVGTGYGSAVTALRLAQAGKRCLMLEMGMDWAASNMEFSGMAWAEKQSTWLRNTTVAPFGNYRIIEKFTGALDRIDFDDVKIYAGRGIGGGSLVNGGMSVTPRRDYFEEIFPNLDADEFYNKYFPLANQELGVNTIPEDFYNNTEYYQFSRAGEAEGTAAGYTPVRVPNVYDYDYMQQEEDGTVPKSAFGGEVIYGNNHGKKDLTKTYLKEAIDTGKVSILGLHKVEQIIQNSDQSYDVKVSEINTKGETIQTKTYKTSKLFLGAGSVGTTKLLLKSKAKGTLPNLDNNVGKNWGNNGNTMAARSFVPTPLGHKQSTIPAAGLESWTADNDAIFAEIAPFPLGMDLRTALYLIINRVPNHGEFTYNEAEDKLELDWGTSHNAHMIQNAEDFLDNMNNVNGGTRGVTFPNGIDETICYHPLGGCVLGQGTDMFGRVNNHEGLYVVDGALIPATIGVNPYVTITALAEYCIETIVAEDFAGSTEQVEEITLNLVASPNPFRNFLNLEFTAPVTTTAKATLYNWANMQVAQTTFSVQAGEQVNHHWSGLWYLWPESYVLKLEVGEFIENVQVVK